VVPCPHICKGHNSEGLAQAACLNIAGHTLEPLPVCIAQGNFYVHFARATFACVLQVKLFC
jgi:hypothetical protein